MPRKAKANRQTRPRKDDDYRAGVVLMLQAAGYPDVKGALARVAKKTGEHPRTISRWFNKESNPPPDRIVTEKKGEIVDRLKTIVHMLLDNIAVDIESNGVDGVRAMTAVGIAVDKIQLLEGKPTGITETTGAIRITNDIDRSEYEAVVAEAEQIVAQAASGQADTT